MAFWAYMPHCRGGGFYTGQTDDLEQRVAEHQAGRGSDYTLDRLPAKLVWSEAFQTRKDAQKAKRKIKGWSRAKEMALIRSDWDKISMLAKSKNSPSTSSGKGEE
jgi:predicted GIY-YIG superfamily endonuclease